ncbi:MAG: helix-turn-helix transcriptional regulator [Lachnospiraceae bacterium]|nr:helix-turn-helix transcriptional regulator [Lachnospiraceae bacterium]
MKREVNRKEFSHERLNEVMQLCGVSAADISRATGVTESKLSEYRSGKRRPGLHNAIMISSFLGVPLEYLLA